MVWVCVWAKLSLLESCLTKSANVNGSLSLSLCYLMPGVYIRQAHTPVMICQKALLRSETKPRRSLNHFLPPWLSFKKKKKRATKRKEHQACFSGEHLWSVSRGPAYKLASTCGLVFRLLLIGVGGGRPSVKQPQISLSASLRRTNYTTIIYEWTNRFGVDTGCERRFHAVNPRVIWLSSPLWKFLFI